MKSLPLALALIAAGTLAAPSSAQTVQSFDGTRCYTSYWLEGAQMVGPYNQLLANGYTVQSTGTITAAGLAGADVFVSGLVLSGTTLSPSEAADLQAWVAAGGGVLYMGDHTSYTVPNNQFASLFSVATFGGNYSGTFAVNIVDPAHPTISGPFGTVNAIGGLIAAGFWTSVSSQATIVATNPDGSAAMIAASYGLGRVILLNDVNYCASPSSFDVDKQILWDNMIDWLGQGNCMTSPASYCTAGTTSSGCHATMGASGMASLGNTGPFTLTCTNVEGNKNGIFFYGITGRVASPWGIGGLTWLCVKSPTQRMQPLMASGGTPGTCTGSFSTDWNAYVAANPNKPVNQAMTPGTLVSAQSWFRDPASGTGPVGAKGTALSDGIEFTVCP